MAGKISLALSAVLAAAVIYLFTQQGSGPAEPEAQETSMPEVAPAAGDALNIAILYEDSVLANYDFMKAREPRINEKLRKKNADLENKVRKYQEEELKAQNFLSSPEATEEYYVSIMQDLQRRQGEIERIQADMQKIELDFLTDIDERVQTFLDDFCEENGIDLLLRHSAAMPITLYREGVPDVTEAVVSGLNAEYAAEMGANE